MKYPIVFWDSGGTIFLSGNRPPHFGGCPTPTEVADKRTFRAECALQMFGYEVPEGLGEVIDELEQALRLADELGYSVEVLANGVFAHLGIEGRQGPAQESRRLAAVYSLPWAPSAATCPGHWVCGGRRGEPVPTQVDSARGRDRRA